MTARTEDQRAAEASGDARLRSVDRGPMRFELDGQLRHDMLRAARKLAVCLQAKLQDQPGHIRADAKAIVSLLRAVEASGGAAGSEPGDELANIEALR